MSNMSYCRFENTCNDVVDCCSELEEVLEKGTSYDEYHAGLSSKHERSAFVQMHDECRRFMELYKKLQNVKTSDNPGGIKQDLTGEI